jgi:hypothetical protein
MIEYPVFLLYFYTLTAMLHVLIKHHFSMSVFSIIIYQQDKRLEPIKNEQPHFLLCSETNKKNNIGQGCIECTLKKQIPNDNTHIKLTIIKSC